MNLKQFWILFKINFKLTYFLIFINLLAYLLTILISVFSHLNSSLTLIFQGAEFVPNILQGEIWRLLTSAFLHGSTIHLIINMWALLTFGEFIERFYGAKKLFLIYILTGITASLVSVVATVLGVYLNQNTAPQYAISIGASGAIFGLVGVLIGSQFRNKTYTYDLPINTTQLWLFVGYNIMLGFGFNFLSEGININNWAHIGGFLGGLLIGKLLTTKNTFSISKTGKKVEQALYILSVIIFIAANLANILYFLLYFI